MMCFLHGFGLALTLSVIAACSSYNPRTYNEAFASGAKSYCIELADDDSFSDEKYDRLMAKCSPLFWRVYCERMEGKEKHMLEYEKKNCKEINNDTRQSNG